MQDQIQGNQKGADSNEALLKYGVDGIRAYVDLSDKELWNAMKSYVTNNSVYASLPALAILTPKTFGVTSSSLGKEHSYQEKLVE